MGWIYAIKPDGSLKWKTSFTSANIRTPDFIAPLVVDRDGNVFACADHGMCYGINALGNVMWASPIAPNRMRTAPHILSDGKMLFLDGQDLYAMTPSVSQVRLPLVNRN